MIGHSCGTRMTDVIVHIVGTMRLKHEVSFVSILFMHTCMWFTLSIVGTMHDEVVTQGIVRVKNPHVVVCNANMT